LPSGYESCLRYVDPLSIEEYEEWIQLPEYPEILRQYSSQVVELSGLVPRMIAELVDIVRKNANATFQDIEKNFINEISPSMKKAHVGYLRSLDEYGKHTFNEMLSSLFLGRSTPNMTVADGGYRDRGLLITLNNKSLRFYNSIARDILFSSFLFEFGSSDNIASLTENFKKISGSEKGFIFEKLFFILFVSRDRLVNTVSSAGNKKILLSSRKWLRLERGRFDPPVDKVTSSCWIQFDLRFPCFDYAFVDISEGCWHIFFLQLSVSKFAAHNQGSTKIENMLKPHDRDPPKLAVLMDTILGESGFEVSVIREDDSIVDFSVLDPRNVSCRDRVSIVYVTPLRSREAFRATSAPKYVDFLTLEGFPEDLQDYFK
jgi:hypothetical protein